MFFRLFNWLVKKVPYCVAVVLPPTIWSLVAAAFGIILIFLRADFETTGTGMIFVYTVLASLTIAAIFGSTEVGLLRLFGIKWESHKDFTVLNDNIVNGRVLPELPSPVLLKVYNSLNRLNKRLMRKIVFYTSVVVSTWALVEWLASKQLINIPIILAAGLIAAPIAVICSTPLWELFISPARRECKTLLVKKNISFQEPSFLSIETKSKFFIVLMALALGTILIIVRPLSPALIVISLITLFIVGFLSKMVFRSFYEAFVEIKESAKNLAQGKEAPFVTGSLDKEIIELSQSLNTSAQELQKAFQEINKRKDDLEKFYKLTVGRELRMIELKKKIKELEEKFEK